MAPSDRTSARRTQHESQAWPGPALTRAELTAAFAQALDLSEAREPGHAARVCFTGLNLAQGLGLDIEAQQTVFFASLLHDAGAAPASAEVCRVINLSEDVLFRARPGKTAHQVAVEVAPQNAANIVAVLRAHAEAGANVARDLGFGPDVQDAIAAHHERWDGQGYPNALKGEDVPVTARIVAAADLIESLIGAEANPLTARRNIIGQLGSYAGNVIDPETAERAGALVRSDAFWLGLHGDILAQEIAEVCPADSEPSTDDLRRFAAVFAGLADARGEHTAGHSERTAELAARIAAELGFPPERQEVLRIAALVHDVGLLGVPARVIAKPDILSLSEMEAMRRHPTFSQLVLESLPGLEELAQWTGAHHERPDGKGYPEMLEDDAIPLEGRIIALADTYVALTSSRPYRKALSDEDAQQVLLGGAGTQLDARLVQVFTSPRFGAPRSSRSAPRLRRKR